MVGSLYLFLTHESVPKKYFSTPQGGVILPEDQRLLDFPHRSNSVRRCSSPRRDHAPRHCLIISSSNVRLNLAPNNPPACAYQEGSKSAHRVARRLEPMVGFLISLPLFIHQPRASSPPNRCAQRRPCCLLPRSAFYRRESARTRRR